MKKMREDQIPDFVRESLQPDATSQPFTVMLT
jgi:hypothetical protein